MEVSPPKGDSSQTQPPATSPTKKPEKALYVPKKEKNQIQEAKPRSRPRYTDKARKNAKNKKDKAGGVGIKTASEGGGDGETLNGEGIDKSASQNNGAIGSNQTAGDEGGPVSNQGGSGSASEPVEEEEDSWDTLFNDDGECLDPHVLEEIAQKTGKKKTSVQEARFDYYSCRDEDGEGDVDLREDELSNIVEIYDFPTEFKTEDLVQAFQSYQQRGFDVQWVDETHALGLFSSPVAAREALRCKHPLMKVRSLSKASAVTRAKARSCSDYLLPAKERPPSSAALARRLVIGALGVKSNQTKEDREAEKKKLQEARDQKRMAAKQRDDAWEGK